MTVGEARAFFRSHETCVAFSFPIPNDDQHGMTHLLKEILFFSCVAAFDHG
jgi:hypothetical protein